ncbi:MAG: radical SAM protein [Bdellovibrionaceae bacterium]|nr:radical SAM protein [Bdellovibrionales bacterium]MCB9084622.1 radical SAM protein [Pseudobdellovibrionaceae bacterium]
MSSCEGPDIQSSVMERAIKLCIPVTLMIEVGQACNFKCQHCYNFDRSKKPTSPLLPIDLSLAKTALIQGRGLGCITLCLTGGEVLAYPHLNELIEEARRLHYAVRLKTNASLVTKQRAQELKALGVSDCEVSVYGMSEATYEAFTGKGNGYSLAKRGIENLLQAGIVVTLNMILHKGNFRELGHMLSWADELGVDYQISQDLTERYDGTKDSLRWRLDAKELRELYESFPQVFLTPVFPRETLNCGCARLQIAIGHDGRVYPCLGAPIEVGDLRHQSLEEIWHQSPTLKWMRGLETEDYKTCGTCSSKDYCQRSSGAVFVNTGNYLGKDEWLCDQAELKQELMST